MTALVNGARVFSAAAGNTALAADQNTIQDILRDCLSAKWMSVLTLGVAEGSVAWSDGNRYYSLGSGTDLLIAPLPVREGQIITGIHLALWYGTGASIGGTLELRSASTEPVAGSMPASSAEWTYSNPYNISSATTWYEITDTTISITVAAKTRYYVVLEGMGTQTTRCAGIDFRAQFGS